MADWIAVDETTRLALRDALGPHGEIGTRTGSALKAALGAGRDCALILPIGDGSEAQLVSIHRLPAAEAQVSPQVTSPATVAPDDTSRFDYIADEPAKGTASNQKQTSKPEAQFEATGFLGLTDEVVYEDEPEQEKKKSWWEKLTR